jgi:regulator of cell morphogenesis and NO signaling
MPFSEITYVKDIVNEAPKTSDVFKRHRIDFCCGGNTPLKSAAAEKGVNLASLMEELQEVYSQSQNQKDDLEVWTNSSSNEIIDHIIDHYHRPLEEELKNLSPYVTKVARVHGERRPELVRIHDLFYELKEELLEHTSKEESDVFPLLKQLDDVQVEELNNMMKGIKELEKEHDHAGSILKELREITTDFEPPLDACGTYRLVFKRLENLEQHTFMHIHLENNILFPRYFED